MSGDRLLDAVLREALREVEEERADPRWDALIEGTISPEDDAALQALAATSERARERYELYRPIDRDQIERLARLAQQALAEAPPAAIQAVEPTNPRRIDSRPAVRRAERSKPRWIARVAAMAAAALFAGVVATRVRPAPAADVPAYEAELRGGSHVLRSGEIEQLPDAKPDPKALPPIYPRGSKLDLTFRPNHSVDGKVDFRAFLVWRNRILPWSPPAQIAQGGSIHIEGPVDTLLPFSPGDWTLVVFVGSPAALANHEEAIARAPLEAPERIARDLVVTRTTFRLAGGAD